MLWADHAGPVAHHTFIWSIYLSILVIAANSTRHSRRLFDAGGGSLCSIILG